MPIPITRFKCIYCKNTYSTNRYATKHESNCFFNKEQRSCVTCKYFNLSFKLEYTKCTLLNRRGTDKKDNGYGDMVPYASFTDFLQRDCEHYRNEYEETVEVDVDGSNK